MIEGEEITDYEFKDFVVKVDTTHELEFQLNKLKAEWKHANVASFIHDNHNNYVAIVSCMRPQQGLKKV